MVIYTLKLLWDLLPIHLRNFIIIRTEIAGHLDTRKSNFLIEPLKKYERSKYITHEFDMQQDIL